MSGTGKTRTSLRTYQLVRKIPLSVLNFFDARWGTRFAKREASMDDEARAEGHDWRGTAHVGGIFAEER